MNRFHIYIYIHYIIHFIRSTSRYELSALLTALWLRAGSSKAPMSSKSCSTASMPPKLRLNVSMASRATRLDPISVDFHRLLIDVHRFLPVFHLFFRAPRASRRAARAPRGPRTPSGRLPAKHPAAKRRPHGRRASSRKVNLKSLQ